MEGIISASIGNRIKVSALAGAALSALGPTGALLGRGGTKALPYGYSSSPGLLNGGTIRLGWSGPVGPDKMDILSLRVGREHILDLEFLGGIRSGADAMGSDTIYDASMAIWPRRRWRDVTTTYTWDSRNRLTGISKRWLTASFVYDGFGRPKSKTINGTTQVFGDAFIEIPNGAIPGRTGMGIHATDPLSGGPLRRTEGCVRVHNTDLNNLATFMEQNCKNEPNTFIKQ